MKYSRQRELIKKVVNSKQDHSTAEAIFDEVKKYDDNVSIATVYRNLNLLVDLGEIKKIQFTGDKDYFEPIVSNHFHYVCKKCKKIQNVYITTDFSSLDEMVQKDIDGSIDSHELVIYGVCSDCAKLNKK